MAESVFTKERRATFLELYASGMSQAQAAAEVDVSVATITRYVNKGRAQEGTDEAEFAESFDAIRLGTAEPSLTRDDLIRLLERIARNGSVQAIRLLLERPWERVQEEAASKPSSTVDELQARRRRAQGL